MEIKTVKAKLSKVKDKAVEIVPRITFGATCGLIVFATGMNIYKVGYSRGVLTGARAGKNAVIDIISDLAKSVETK